MKIQRLHPDFALPIRGSEHGAGYDLYMPESGEARHGIITTVGLGFATEIPEGFAALLMTRSSAGGKGLELVNTIGLIDSDYRGEWKAKLTVKPVMTDSWDAGLIRWRAGERLLQFILVPVGILTQGFQLVESVAKTERGEGGFGSTGA